MNILHITAGVGKAAFGVAPVVMGLAREQQKLGHSVQIWHADSKENEQWASEYSGLDISTFRSFPTVGPRQLCYSPAMEKAAITDGAKFDIIHHHGLWLALARVTTKWRRKFGKPTVVAPHGMLAPWALTLSRSKKRLAYMLYERDNLSGASCLHACSDLERKHVKAFGLNKPVTIIPNAVEDSWLSSSGNGNIFRSKHSIAVDARVILFMGRLAPIKGLETLFGALSLIRQDSCEYVLVVAGSGAQDYEKSLRSIAGERVRFVGPLYGQDKRDAFDSADMFVLPSHSENFGIAAAEALGSGIPVITTTGTPWEELVAHKCGWWVKASEESLAGALNEALAMPKSVLETMGENGRQLVETRYTWDICGKTSVEAYGWLLQGGKSPACVRLADGE